MPVGDGNGTGAGATLALACALIARASVTPDDAGCQRLLGERLARLGFELTPLRYGEVDNLWAVVGRSGPLLAFAGHTDVVPPGPVSHWRTPPFEPTLRDGVLYGRGAADMKGSLAAMVTACERYLARGRPLQGRLALLLTSDEEGPARDGTVRVVDWLTRQGTTIDWCVVGEPSSDRRLGDTVRVGRRGSLNARLLIKGVQGHVAFPDKARNPVHQALPALAELAAMRWDEGDEAFPPTSFQISNAAAGTGADNVIPGELELRFNFRFNTLHSADSLAHTVESLLARHGLAYTLDWQLSGNPFLTRRGALIDTVTAAIHQHLGIDTELSTGGGTSDGRFIAPTGAQVVELGPCNASIHQVDEHVIAADLDALSAVYEDLIGRLLGGA